MCMVMVKINVVNIWGNIWALSGAAKAQLPMHAKCVLLTSMNAC